MRTETVLAGIGGLVAGHILWLIAITLATDTSSVSSWVLVVGAASVLLAVGAVLWGRRLYQSRSREWATFLWCVPALPVMLSVVVLGVTYL